MEKAMKKLLKQRLDKNFRCVYLTEIFDEIGLSYTGSNIRIAQEILGKLGWKKSRVTSKNRILYQYNYFEDKKPKVTVNVRTVKYEEIAQYLFEQKQLREYDTSGPFRSILKWEELDNISRQPYYGIAKNITDKYNVSESLTVKK